MDRVHDVVWLIGLGIAVVLIGFAIYLAPYRMRRLMTFLEPEADEGLDHRGRRARRCSRQ